MRRTKFGVQTPQYPTVVMKWNNRRACRCIRVFTVFNIQNLLKSIPSFHSTALEKSSLFRRLFSDISLRISFRIERTSQRSQILFGSRIFNRFRVEKHSLTVFFSFRLLKRFHVARTENNAHPKSAVVVMKVSD
uniref:Uncharacterized protein n=1 Tax=Caenorhabditis japonica TaxID=281687 RepID=A0A8R1E797_CAEJA